MEEEQALINQLHPALHPTRIAKGGDSGYATEALIQDELEGAPKDQSSSDITGNNTPDDDITRLYQTTVSGNTPKPVKPRIFPDIPRTAVKVEPFETKAAKTGKCTWSSISKYTASNASTKEKNNTDYCLFSLLVKLRFSGQLVIQEIPNPDTQSTNTSSIPLPWTDETHTFNMLTVRSTLRPSTIVPKDLGPNYAWYNSAVPVDALLPPGIQLSAKEILAFYSHHVRWKDVMIRLARSGYKGTEILGIQSFFRGTPDNKAITPAIISGFQRDALRPSASSSSSHTQPHPLSQSQSHTQSSIYLHPGKHIPSHRHGLSLPSLSDLLNGLHHLPSGPDARCLTECLAWYMRNADAFTPRLELNVLHVQALTRALRVPLREAGMSDLDALGLEEWKRWGVFDRRVCVWGNRITNTASATAGVIAGAGQETEVGVEKGTSEKRERSKLLVDIAKEKVSLEVQLPLRYVFTFPFLTVQGMVGEALKMGIEKAEGRSVKRVGEKVSGEDGEGAER